MCPDHSAALGRLCGARCWDVFPAAMRYELGSAALPALRVAVLDGACQCFGLGYRKEVSPSEAQSWLDEHISRWMRGWLVAIDSSLNYKPPDFLRI